MTIKTILGLLSAMTGAMNVALLAYPHDLVPQIVLIVVGVLAATFAAGVAFINSNVTINFGSPK